MRSYKDYRWIVTDADLLGGRLTIRGTRLSVSLVLNCLAEGMDAQEIRDTYGPFPEEALPDILHLAAEQVDSLVAA